jgi:hypothetical protein
MKQVDLGRGYYAVVDADVCPIINIFSWRYDGRYAKCKLNGKRDGANRKPATVLYLHQMIMGGAKDGLDIDHINRDKLDCRRTNLRYTTRAKNNINREYVAGVRKSTNGTKWYAYATVDYRNVHLGTFDTYEEARAARQAWEVVNG